MVQYIKEIARVYLKKICILTPICFLMALFFPGLDKEWMGAFVGLKSLAILAFGCTILNCLHVCMQKKWLLKYSQICHQEALEVYCIVMASIWGLWLGSYIHVEYTEWSSNFKVILNGHGIFILLVSFYKLPYTCVGKFFIRKMGFQERCGQIVLSMANVGFMWYIIV